MAKKKSTPAQRPDGDGDWEVKYINVNGRRIRLVNLDYNDNGFDNVRKRDAESQSDEQP